MSFCEPPKEPSRNLTEATLPFSYPTSRTQNVAIGILIAFPALAFLTVGTRVAGTLSSRRFGCGKWPPLHGTSAAAQLADTSI
ncbi:uncharacterized protein BCR38DRAFT_89137 [Pseudomassariella vexata]|uniref:Uncharacterized protein n=1 Tax=Pseudomassariella vexata TaxID=1141098 RepID=A0A1Y2EEC8_9PEZI|nr:uncharacterized protein BCR38DRAFT_89137 [Pseudomassariella vexata]ORY69616.1 hypothetical protein BCR38DRAFT_89137 [Pseudomassariella vexata]